MLGAGELVIARDGWRYCSTVSAVDVNDLDVVGSSKAGLLVIEYVGKCLVVMPIRATDWIARVSTIATTAMAVRSNDRVSVFFHDGGTALS